MDNFYWLQNHFKIPNDLFQIALAFDLLAFWIEVILLMVQKSQGQPPDMISNPVNYLVVSPGLNCPNPPFSPGRIRDDQLLQVWTTPSQKGCQIVFQPSHFQLSHEKKPLLLSLVLVG